MYQLKYFGLKIIENLTKITKTIDRFISYWKKAKVPGLAGNSTKPVEPKPSHSAILSILVFILLLEASGLQMAASATSITLSPDHVQDRKKGSQGVEKLPYRCLSFYQGGKYFSAHFPFYFIGWYLIIWLPITTKRGWKRECVTKWGQVCLDCISRSNHNSSLSAAYTAAQTKSESVSAILCAW